VEAGGARALPTLQQEPLIREQQEPEFILFITELPVHAVTQHQQALLFMLHQT
jgi:hypothetical protein